MMPPSDPRLWIDALMVLLLLVTIGYCFRLSRRLATLRAARGEMAAAAAELEQAGKRARESLAELRRAGDSLGVELEQRLARGRELSDELRRMTESADAVETRLALVPAGPDLGAGRGAARAHAPSESERELRRALSAAR